MSIYGNPVALGGGLKITNLFTSAAGATSGELTDSVLNYKLVLIECTVYTGGKTWKNTQLYSHDIIAEAVNNGVRVGAANDNAYCWIEFSSATAFSRVVGTTLTVQYIWGIN